jgi:hypothetical protein
MTTKELDVQTITDLPQPSHKHSTCAWCYQQFDTIVELLDHVDNAHLDSKHAHTGRALAAA